jgi:hypothetical protein
MPKTLPSLSLLAGLLALAVTLLVPTAQAGPGLNEEAPVEATASAKCGKYLSRAKRAKKGSAKRKKLVAKYRACKRRAAAAPTPPAAQPAPAPAPAPLGSYKYWCDYTGCGLKWVPN